MEIIRQRITREDLVNRYTTSYPTVTKAVVDLGRKLMAVDAEWHADLEVALLENGSSQKDLWGINLFVYKPPSDFIAFESLINIRPSQKNFSIEITDENLQNRIRRVVDVLVDYGQGMVVQEPAVLYEVGLGTAVALPATVYPCFKQHKQLTMEKWRSFEAYKRVLMIANEFGRARHLIRTGSFDGVDDCYERALELFHITGEAARIENLPKSLIYGLLRLRERTAKLYIERKLDKEENDRICEELIALDPVAYAQLHPETEEVR